MCFRTSTPSPPSGIVGAEVCACMHGVAYFLVSVIQGKQLHISLREKQSHENVEEKIMLKRG